MNKKVSNKENCIKETLEESCRVKSEVITHCTNDIIRAADLITASYKKGGKLLICGNGGSAADAQHLACEFVSRLSKDFQRPALGAIALTTDTSFLTAFPNDINFDDIFLRQVQALWKPTDILFGISTSGNSENVIRAINEAKRLGLHTIGLAGQSGKMKELCDICISVPSNQNQRIQESHIAIYHLICYLVERDLFGE